MSQGASKYVVDPADPRAPPMDVWEAMSDAERATVVAALPSDPPTNELEPPEGDTHRLTIEQTKDPLEGFFERLKRNVYISSNLAVYYPDERFFAPDLFAVLDVDPRPREKWVVADEKRGLDFVLEVNVGGDRNKDFRFNVERYARLGIAEYFIFDPPRLIVRSYALAPGSKTYEPVLGQNGRFPSKVLGLDLGIQDDKLRFFYNGALVPATRDLLGDAEKLLSNVMARYDDAIRRFEEERMAREQTEARLAEALAEIERLKKR